MKLDKICMQCGKRFHKFRIRVINDGYGEMFRDFCSYPCLVKYYKKVVKQEQAKSPTLQEFEE